MAAKKKLQRRYVIGSLYTVKGSGQRERKLEFVGRFKIERKEHLIFKEQRRVKKMR